jgi:hypothetical protein
MTDNNSILDIVSINVGASKGTIATTNSIAHAAKLDVANCSDLGKVAASSENTTIEKVARLAQRYAAGAPPDGELKALKARFISQRSNSEKSAGINLARPLSTPSSQNAWIAPQAHVGERVRPTTKARRRLKQYIPMVLWLAFFMCFVGPIDLDEAYESLFSGKKYPMVGRATDVVPTNANREPGASGGTGRIAFRQGCEIGWNVMPPEQRCVSDSLWGPEELSGGYRFFDPKTTFSTVPDQYLSSWARSNVSQSGAAFQIPRSTAQGFDRQATAEASDRPKYPSLSASDKVSPSAAPSTPASEHPTVEQQREASTKLRNERLPSRVNPLPRARPKTTDH